MDRPTQDPTSSLAEHNPGPVCRLARDGSILYANPAAQAAFGAAACSDGCWFDLLRVPTIEAFRGALADGTPVEVQADMDARVFLFRMTPTDGEMLVYGTDITELRSAERRAAVAAAHVAEMARFPDMNPGPVMRVRPDGRVTRANLAAERLFAGTADDERRVQDLAPELGPAVQAATSDTAPHVVQVIIGRRHMAFTLTWDPGSELVFAFGQDVTDLHRAEALVREMARFPERNPGPVLRVSADGTIALANKAACTLFDDELVGASWRALCPALGEAAWGSLVGAGGNVAVEQIVGSRELLFTHRSDGSGASVYVFGADLTALKTAQRALQHHEKLATLGTLSAGVAHELNNPAAAARRAAQHLTEAFAQLQASQLRLGDWAASPNGRILLLDLDGRARAASADPGDLNPLTRSDREGRVEDWLGDRSVPRAWEIAPDLVAMGLDVDALEDIATEVDPDHLTEVLTWLGHSFRVYALLSEIGQGTGRLSEIVGALRAYTYLGRAERQPVDVNEGLRNTLIVLRAPLREGVQVTLDLAEDLPTVDGHGSELNQVWTNLIHNAIDAMQGHGQLQVRTRAADDGVVVEIVDDGPGIPTSVCHRVFDPFFTTKEPGKGTGLGLHTSYKIVAETHGGRIDVDSEPGHTRFRVWLPLSAQPQEPS